MPGISDTAYPRLKSNPSAKELDEIYTPNLFECGWVEERTREPVPRVGLFVLLKTFQRLGYFVMLKEVPAPILQHIAQCAGYEWVPGGLDTYDGSSVRRRHMTVGPGLRRRQRLERSRSERYGECLRRGGTHARRPGRHHQYRS